MRIAKAKLKSVSPYSQGKYHNIEKQSKELHGDYEKRTWREKCHYNEDGNIIIPPMAFANCIKEAATYLSIQIAGQGKSKYTKHFQSGILVQKPIILEIKKDEVQGEWLFVPSDGRRGGTTRVEKCFPLIREWSGEVDFYIFDNIITKEIFTQVLKEAGNIIGIGRFRPKNWGYYGRFIVEKIDWKD
jgi:hypothetical protein